jgi:hypothetical protein
MEAEMKKIFTFSDKSGIFFDIICNFVAKIAKDLKHN